MRLFNLITDPDYCEMCYLNGFLHIWQALGVSGTTFVRKVCMKFDYVCKPVFCEHNLPVEATVHSSDTHLEERDYRTCFTKLNISLWLLGQIRWGLHWLVENNHRFIIPVWFFRSHKSVFRNQYPNADCIFLRDNRYIYIQSNLDTYNYCENTLSNGCLFLFLICMRITE